MLKRRVSPVYPVVLKRSVLLRPLMRAVLLLLLQRLLVLLHGASIPFKKICWDASAVADGFRSFFVTTPGAARTP